jgi:hypothetical protein
MLPFGFLGFKKKEDRILLTCTSADLYTCWIVHLLTCIHLHASGKICIHALNLNLNCSQHNRNQLPDMQHNDLQHWNCTRCKGSLSTFSIHRSIILYDWDLTAFVGYWPDFDAIFAVFRGTDSKSISNWASNLDAHRRLYSIPGVPAEELPPTRSEMFPPPVCCTCYTCCCMVFWVSIGHGHKASDTLIPFA